MLVFHLKREFFEKVKQGKKTHEYRRWSNKYKYLNNYVGADFTKVEAPIIRLDLGYAKITETKKQIFAQMVSCRVVDAKGTDFQKIDPQYNGKVYDVEFKLIENRGGTQK